jgi:hypothetical protein
MRIQCKCGNWYDSALKGAIKRYCSKKCQRKDYYEKNKERENVNAAKWYQSNRDSEIAKNKEYRKEKKELFDWYHDKNRFNGMKEIILSRDNHECRVCSSKEKLIIHHKDETGESSLKTKNIKDIEINNDINNLITLCQFCHMRLHHWQRRNKVMLKNDEKIIKLLKELNKNGKNSSYWRLTSKR